MQRGAAHGASSQSLSIQSLVVLGLLCFVAFQSVQNEARGRLTRGHLGAHVGGEAGASEHAAQGHSSGASAAPMMMPMYFVNSIHATLWIREWTTDGLLSYSLSLCFLVAFAFAHEALAAQRSLYLGRISREPKPRRLTGREKLWLATLYTLNMATSYALMLAVMTYNLGFCVAILLGLGSGYFALTDMTLGGSSVSGGSISDLQQVLTRSDACCEANRGIEQT